MCALECAKLVTTMKIAIIKNLATIELPITTEKAAHCLPVMTAHVQINIAAPKMALLGRLVTMDIPVSVSLAKLIKGATTKQTMRKCTMPIPRRKMRIFDGGH